MRHGATCLIVALSLAACSGCGAEAGAYVGSTVPVKGTVTYKGKPLTRGEVVFEPDSGGREAHGTIGPDGRFELSTYSPGDGAVVGLHRVAVTGTDLKNGVSLKYKNLSSSGVEVEVAEGRGEYAIDLR